MNLGFYNELGEAGRMHTLYDGFNKVVAKAIYYRDEKEFTFPNKMSWDVFMSLYDKLVHESKVHMADENEIINLWLDEDAPGLEEFKPCASSGLVYSTGDCAFSDLKNNLADPDSPIQSIITRIRIQNSAFTICFSGDFMVLNTHNGPDLSKEVETFLKNYQPLNGISANGAAKQPLAL